jgi:hypothetical protein
MKKFTLLLALSIVVLTGCDLAEWTLSDVYDWNLSACGESFDSFGTCWQLYWDNADRLVSGATIP